MYNNYIRRFFMEYMQMEPVITRQMVLNELVRAGINREIADDLSYRYYKNELTIKDLQYLKENFDIKLEMLERGLKSDIKELDTKIDTVENNLNIKIDIKFTELDNKIDIIENNLKSDIKELDNKIDKVRDELKSDIKGLDTKIDIVSKDMEVNKMELDTKIDKFASEVKGTFKLHAWMFGTIITINVGIFLALISMLYALFIK
ncbi:BDR-repeat family protein (plasmid) [Borrelia crocidurae DOU]|uniref:BDR-repeat family protein n=2 Tax=Borrelia crocidurae TaxID=29520 RepID=W5SJB3_9SPIR|nr:BDR-repeat family protein [Borrelia crocidurae DOU]